MRTTSAPGRHLTVLQPLSLMLTALRQKTSHTPGSSAGPMQIIDENLPIGLRPRIPEKV